MGVTVTVRVRVKVRVRVRVRMRLRVKLRVERVMSLCFVVYSFDMTKVRLV
jgi:hypothetical protein